MNLFCFILQAIFGFNCNCFKNRRKIINSKSNKNSHDKNNNNNYKEIQKFYNLGLEAEKNQIFSYLPYISTSKDTVKEFLAVFAFYDKSIDSNEITGIKVENKYFNTNKNFDYSYDMHRQELIILERKSKRDMYGILKKNKYKKNMKVINHSIPRQKRIIQSYDGLTKIMFSDIDFKYDHIEKGKFL